jgi:HPt (histidine-containing phosphotransfer) domain-containing protein
MAHLARQTMGDRGVEREVLALFLQQLSSMMDTVADADNAERLRLAHTLKGSARGVGALAIAACAEDMEAEPGSDEPIRRLAACIDEVRDFVAAISR